MNPAFGPTATEYDWRRSVRPGLLALGAVYVFMDVTLQPGTALALVVLSVVGFAVCLEPKIAYLLLPVTVPWGSEFTLPVGPAPISPSDVAVAALALGWVVGMCRVRRVELLQNRWTLSLVLMLIVMLLSVTQAASVVQSVKELVKWLEVLVAVLLAPTFLRSERDLWMVLATTVGAAVVESWLGIVQFIFQVGPKNFVIGHHFMRAYGSFGQPNPFAGYLNMVLALAVAAAWVTHHWVFRLAAAFIGLGCVLSLSRSAWAAGVLGLVAVALCFAPRLRPLVPMATLGGLVLGSLASLSLFPTGPFTKLASSFGLTAVNFHNYTAANYSEIERVAHWVAGLRMFNAHPFLGVGIGNYPAAYPAYHVGAFVLPLGHAHNYFINIAAEAGIMGLFAYVFFLVAGFSQAFLTARSASASPIARVLGIGVLGLWVSSTFHNLFDVLYVHEIPTLIGVLMGALLVATTIPRARPSRVGGAIPYVGATQPPGTQRGNTFGFPSASE